MGIESGYSPDLEEMIKAERSMTERQRILTEGYETGKAVAEQIGVADEKDGLNSDEASPEERIDNIYNNCDVVPKNIKEIRGNVIFFEGDITPGSGFWFYNEDRAELRQAAKSGEVAELLKHPDSGKKMGLRINGKVYPAAEKGNQT